MRTILNGIGMMSFLATSFAYASDGRITESLAAFACAGIMQIWETVAQIRDTLETRTEDTHGSPREV